MKKNELDLSELRWISWGHLILSVLSAPLRHALPIPLACSHWRTSELPSALLSSSRQLLKKYKKSIHMFFCHLLLLIKSYFLSKVIRFQVKFILLLFLSFHMYPFLIKIPCIIMSLQFICIQLMSMCGWVGE